MHVACVLNRNVLQYCSDRQCHQSQQYLTTVIVDDRSALSEALREEVHASIDMFQMPGGSGAAASSGNGGSGAAASSGRG